jgi:hypothetical protein
MQSRHLNSHTNDRYVLLTTEAEVKLRPTVGWPEYLGVGLTSGTYDQIFVFCVKFAGFLDVRYPL